MRRSNTSSYVRRTLDFTAATGPDLASGAVNYTTNNAPVVVVPLIIGVDAINLTGTEPMGSTFSFPAIIKRNVAVNPLNTALSAQNERIPINTGLVIFNAVCQGLNTHNVSFITQARTDKNILVPGPFLGPNTYINFQVVVNNPDAVPCTVVGTLYYQQATG